MESDAHLSPMLPTDLPTGYPESAQQWVELPTGDRILIRPIIPEDVERIAHAFAGGEGETIRTRFFTAAPPSERPHLMLEVELDVRLHVAETSRVGREQRHARCFVTVTMPSSSVRFS